MIEPASSDSDKARRSLESALVLMLATPPDRRALPPDVRLGRAVDI